MIATVEKLAIPSALPETAHIPDIYIQGIADSLEHVQTNRLTLLHHSECAIADACKLAESLWMDAPLIKESPELYIADHLKRLLSCPRVREPLG